MIGEEGCFKSKLLKLRNSVGLQNKQCFRGDGQYDLLGCSSFEELGNKSTMKNLNMEEISSKFLEVYVV